MTLRGEWIVAALVAAIVSTAHAQTPACREGLSPETAERVFAVLNHPPAETGCVFEGVETHQARLEAHWSYNGVRLPSLSVVPHACAPEGAPHTGPFVIDVPPEIGHSCPSVIPLIDALIKPLAVETAARESGSVDDPLFRGARTLFVGILLVALGVFIRGAAKRRGLDAPWVVVGIAGFSAALGLRASLPFTLGNWYAEVLPATGPPPWMRFGPGFFAFQSLLRDVGLWNARMLVVSQLLLGAAALPLLLGVLWELRVGLYATAATLVLLVFAPFHARLSATTSEHVLASTLCLGLLLCWLRTVRTGSSGWFALTVLLFPAVCATRVDMIVQASLVLVWPLMRDRTERDGGLHGWPMWWRAGFVGLVAASTLVVAYRFIILPAHHPAPERAAQFQALHESLRQFWYLAKTDPGWISLPAVLLAILGGVAMALRRPLLLLRIAGTLLVAFGALGRSLTSDELLGARYFLFTIPILLIASGQGFAALLALVPPRRRAVAAAVGIVVLGTWSGLAARGAYAVRYAFQDEYTFARAALARLPSGCRVYAVPMRSDGIARDVDCCLDIRRSPLTLEFPALRFLDLPDDPARVFEDPGCVAYYESIVCQLHDDPNDPSVHDRAEQAADYFRQRCAGTRRVGHLEALAETTTSPRATVNFFHGNRPHAGLYRWTP